ncbi:hypothetical protein GCM10027422_23150 [Hymenobacter arcticus]
MHIIITRTTEKETVIQQENSTDPDYKGKATPYVHPVTTNLSEANKQGLDNLAYWRNGIKGSRVYILNQALSQYLAQYRESQRAIPADEF